MRHVILIACIGLVACNAQPLDDAARFRPQDMKIVQSGMQRAFPRCGLAVTFSIEPKPEITSEQIKLPGAQDLATKDALTGETMTYAESATCLCFKTLVPTNISRSDAIFGAEKNLATLDTKVKSSDFDEQGKYGKTLTLTLTRLTPAGAATLRGRTIYLPHCTFTAVGGGITKPDLDSADAFIRTITTIASNTPDTPPDKSASVADKLRELNSLHDQKLITDDEYKAKRKTILDSM